MMSVVMGMIYFSFIIWDGMVRNNIAPEAAPFRAGLVAVIAICALIVAWRAGARIPLPAALAVGVMAALAVTEAYHVCCGQGYTSWIIFSGVFAAWYVARRDARDTFAIAGLLLSITILLFSASGQARPEMWNRNMVAGALVALAPAGVSRFKWVGIFYVTSALLASGSRGALVAGDVAAGFVLVPRVRRNVRWLALPSGALAVAGLVAVRPKTFWLRAACADQVLGHWLATSPAWGLGQFRLPLTWGEFAINAHSVPLTILAITGYAGLVVIALAVIALANRLYFPRGMWQIAALVAICTHALVEENISWWPVTVAAAIVAADVFQSSNLEFCGGENGGRSA